MTQQTQDGAPLQPGDEGFSAPGAEEQPFAQPQQDYFGFSETHRFYFPDGVTFIEFSSMNEGQRKQFQTRTNRDVKVRRGGEATLSMDVGGERWALIQAVASGWNLAKLGPNGMAVQPFNTNALTGWLNVADPKIVSDLEFEIRKVNSWLGADMSVADIDKEIENLQELRVQVAADEERKALSSGN